MSTAKSPTPKRVVHGARWHATQAAHYLAEAFPGCHIAAFEDAPDQRRYNVGYLPGKEKKAWKALVARIKKDGRPAWFVPVPVPVGGSLLDHATLTSRRKGVSVRAIRDYNILNDAILTRLDVVCG